MDIEKLDLLMDKQLNLSKQFMDGTGHLDLSDILAKITDSDGKIPVKLYNIIALASEYSYWKGRYDGATYAKHHLDIMMKEKNE